MSRMNRDVRLLQDVSVSSVETSSTDRQFVADSVVNVRFPGGRCVLTKSIALVCLSVVCLRVYLCDYGEVTDMSAAGISTCPILRRRRSRDACRPSRSCALRYNHVAARG